MKSRMQLPRQGTAVLLIDVQDRLVPTLQPDALARCTRYSAVLLRMAQTLKLPVWVTEQYPKGLGPTIPELKALLPNTPTPLPKVEFSAAEVPALLTGLRAAHVERVVVCGMETHICVLQTVMGLRARGFAVWVAQDACCSRTADNWQAGLRLCTEAGAHVAPTESILFLLMGRAGTPEFKDLSALIK